MNNCTPLLILQHIAERSHRFNTVRIVDQALRHSEVIAGHTKQLSESSLPILPGAGLLYPHDDALPLDQIPTNKRPSQLVVIDGTWHQAKTIVRDVAQLHRLPCYRLSPSQPGNYRIRREPTHDSLSTLEAVVSALKSLEPDTAGLDQLLVAFDTMVEAQLGHPSTASWRNRARPNRPRYVPQAMLYPSSQIVIAYGEGTPHAIRTGPPQPIHWMARRLSESDYFECCLPPPTRLSDEVLSHMRLPAAAFDNALLPESFRRQWESYLKPKDVLIIYHHRTAQLLKNIGAAVPTCLVLKSVFGAWRDDFHSLEELFEKEGLSIPTAPKHRSHERLEMAATLVTRLRASFADHG